MRGILLHCNRFSFEDKEVSTRPFPIKQEDIQLGRQAGENLLAVLLCIEQGDEYEYIHQAALRVHELNQRFFNLGKILVMPFVHLSNNIEEPQRAKSFCELFSENLSERGYETTVGTFGTHKDAFINLAGHPASVSYFEYPFARKKETLKKIPEVEGLRYSKEEIDYAVEKRKLLVLYIAYNTRCNLACPFCSTERGEREGKELAQKGLEAPLLNFQEIKKLIMDGARMGANAVCFYGEGEPLLDKELFFRAVERIREHGMTPVLYTNGTLIDCQTAKRLFESKVSIVAKLYSLKSGVNELLTGEKHIYRYAKQGGACVPSYIKHLLEAGYKGTNRFALHTVVIKKNYPEIEEIWKWEREQGIIPHMDFLYAPMDLDISKEQREMLSKKIWELDKELGYDYEFSTGSRLGHGKCDMRATLFIGPRGFGRVCFATYRFLGNAREAPLSRIYGQKLAADKNLNRYCDQNCVYCDCYKFNKHLESIGKYHERACNSKNRGDNHENL